MSGECEICGNNPLECICVKIKGIRFLTIDDFLENKKSFLMLRNLLLDFMVASMHDFRDKEPYEISLRESLDYIDDFLKIKEEIYKNI